MSTHPVPMHLVGAQSVPLLCGHLKGAMQNLQIKSENSDDSVSYLNASTMKFSQEPPKKF